MTRKELVDAVVEAARAAMTQPVGGNESWYGALVSLRTSLADLDSFDAQPKPRTVRVELRRHSAGADGATYVANIRSMMDYGPLWPDCIEAVIGFPEPTVVEGEVKP